MCWPSPGQVYRFFLITPPNMSHPFRTPVVLRRILFGTLLFVAPLQVHAQSPSLVGLPASGQEEEPDEPDGFVQTILVNIARAQIGRRYVWGGNGPESGGFDCSGLTRYLMRALNVSLPRTADEQAHVGREVPKDISRLRVGDLLTFGNSRRISHIGVYLGDGRVVHASSHYGQVKEVAFAPGTSLYRRWYGARRVLAQGDTLKRGRRS